MPQVRPFSGWRYASEDTDISTLCAPPYDVLSQEERDQLAQANPHNVVELELAPGALELEEPGNRYATAKATWDEWVETGVVERDRKPSIYVLEQAFEVDGQPYRRTCFLVAMKLHDFSERVVIPHELTLPKALGDRYRMLSTTNLNMSPVFALYSDPSPAYAEMLAEIKEAQPVATATADDGVQSTLWKVDDPATILEFMSIVEDEQAFIADGHHRYTVALAWCDEYRNQAELERQRNAVFTGTIDYPELEEELPSDYVMVALSNMDDPQLRILAYNRAVKAEGEFDPQGFLAQLEPLFEVAEGEVDSLDPQGPPQFAIIMKGQPTMVARLRDDVDLEQAMGGSHSPAWRELDVSVLHELVVRPLLGIDPEQPQTLARIAYSQSVPTLVERLEQGTSDVVFAMRPTRLDQLREVSLAGETMPQKATFFYPKLPSGMVFRSLD